MSCIEIKSVVDTVNMGIRYYWPILLFGFFCVSVESVAYNYANTIGKRRDYLYGEKVVRGESEGVLIRMLGVISSGLSWLLLWCFAVMFSHILKVFEWEYPNWGLDNLDFMISSLLGIMAVAAIATKWTSRERSFIQPLDIYEEINLKTKLKQMIFIVCVMLTCKLLSGWSFAKTFLDETIFFITILYLCFFLRVLHNLADIYWDEQLKYRTLRSLFGEFRYKTIKKRILPDDEELDQSISYLLYLFAQTIDKCNKGRYGLKEVSVNWNTNLLTQTDRFKYQRKQCYIRLTIFILAYTIIISLMNADVGSRILSIGLVLVLFLGVILYQFDRCSVAVIHAIYQVHGYEFIHGKKRSYVSMGGYSSKGKYCQFVRDTKSILAYYCTLVESKQNDNANSAKQMVYLCEEKRKEIPEIVIILIVIDYFNCTKYCEDASIKNIKINIEKEDFRQYEKYSKAFIADIERCIDEQNLSVDENRFKAYANQYLKSEKPFAKES